jgi:hypothetical protein
MAEGFPGRWRSLSTAFGRGHFGPRGFFHRGREKRPEAIRGLSTRGASAMIGVHRIGGGESHPSFGRRRGISRALGGYSGGHVLAKVLSSAVLGIDAYRVDLL